MLKVLVKKQLSEVFRSYFYDAKKNKMRSKGAIAAWFVFFAVVMVGVLGGMFTAMSLSLCVPLHAAGMGWLYYLLMSLIAVMLGAFGSVFNTYSGLYLAKDNDLLLSMPIPVRTIVAARLVNVYLLGALYSVVVILPAVIVGWVTVPLTAGRIVCGFLLLLIVTDIVLLLSAHDIGESQRRHKRSAHDDAHNERDKFVLQRHDEPLPSFSLTSPSILLPNLFLLPSNQAIVIAYMAILAICLINHRILQAFLAGNGRRFVPWQHA